MFKRVYLPFHAIEAIGLGRPLAVAVLCLGMTVPILADQPPANNAPGAPPAKEESVLVATREAPPSKSAVETASAEAAPADADERETLEPISQSSDYTPELASDSEQDDASTHFDDVLVKAAELHEDTAPTEIAKPEPNDMPEEDMSTASGSARRAASASANAVPFEPVKFQGASVGKTSKHELITAWGQPGESSQTDEGEVLVFKKPPFQAVEALIGANDVVSSIKITLATPLDAKQLAEQLGLDRLDPVIVTDDADAAVCQAYAERGVLFMFGQAEAVTPVDEDAPKASDTTHVSQVVLQPIDSRAFAYRAENRLHGPYAQNINDLKTAIAIDPEFARAYWLLAKIYLATGQADLADAAAAEACEIEPNNASFQLCHAHARELLGEYDDAVLAVRAVLDRDDLAQIDRA